MREPLRREIAARAFVTLGALAPYYRLLTFNTLFVTDDTFASDIFNGELPIRALVGEMIRNGQVPVWTNRLCSGVPLAGVPWDPFGLAAFSLLSPAAALDVLVVFLLLVAAHGAYGLARRVGVNRPGAVLAGVAFAGSGYIAAQLKHLGIIATVVWLPAGLNLLDRAFAQSHAGPEAPPELARRSLALGLFGLVFAQQALSGFPQSAYICGLVYAAFAVFRAVTNRQQIGRMRLSLLLLAETLVMAVLAAASGAVVLLPLYELTAVSDRSQTGGLEWATFAPYWLPNVLTFLFPYINGDISNNTYAGSIFRIPSGSLFWEDYGYVGIATFLLAIYGADREARRPVVAFFGVMTLIAFLLVLGRSTPVFPLAYYVVPGLKMFRFPTRFLIVVELGLAVLAGVGLTRLGGELHRRFGAVRHRLPHLAAWSVCLFTAADLLYHQPRQNPMVPADAWLAPPSTVATIRADTPQPRTFTPEHRDVHRHAFGLARGWTDVSVYFRLRDLLAPNTGGGFWNLPSADCYSGAAPRWYLDVWGDHNRPSGVVPSLTGRDQTSRALIARPALPNVLKTFGVTHLLSPDPVTGTPLPLVSHGSTPYVYRVDGKRVRFVRAARHVRSEAEAAARLVEPSFDPDREVLLHEAPPGLGPTVAQGDEGGSIDEVPRGSAGEHAVITGENDRELEIQVDAPADGFLLVADMYYPGWSASLDGQTVSIHRANISYRAVQLPKGRHVVRMAYDARPFFLGLKITISAVAILLLLVSVACWTWARRQRTTPLSA